MAVGLLAMLLTVPAAGLVALPPRAVGLGTYVIVQPTAVPPVVEVVTPLASPLGVRAFYGYDGSANPPFDLMRPRTSQLFLYLGADGLSLVMIHGAHNGRSGHANLTITGLPSPPTWIVEDDPTVLYRTDFYNVTEVRTPAGSIYNATAGWYWVDCCTDGGALRGGFGSAAFAAKVEATFGPYAGNTIQAWHFLSGDRQDPDRIALNMTQPLFILGAP